MMTYKLLPGYYFNELALYEEREEILKRDIESFYSLFEDYKNGEFIEFLTLKD